MKIETSKNILNVCGVIDMVYGILEIVLGVLTMTGGGLLSALGMAVEEGAEVAGALVLWIGIGIVLFGVFSLAEGVLSRKAVKDPSKAKPACVFAVISLGFTVISLVSAIANSASPMSALAGVVLNGLLVTAAYTVHKDTTTEVAAVA